MPWRTATVETERARFVIEAELSEHSFSEVCRRYGISRATGYKWRNRAEAGLEALQDRSRRPLSCSHATCPDLVERILDVRKRFGWGARKIRRVLEKDPGLRSLPCVDTIQRILDRYGYVQHGKPRRRQSHPGPPLPFPDRPNGTWTADFKGEFRTRDGNLCFPLTVQDGYSRFLLECRGMLRLDLQVTLRRFRHLFREFGLPERIRTDNGVPFASRALGRLSQLSVWWVTLGITPEFIEPGKPQQNPRHERMHRDLKREATRPPRPDLRAQQLAFNNWRRVYNYERPHESLAMQTPSAIYQPSPRPFPERSEPLVYPAHFEVRRVAGDSTIRWKSRKVFVSQLLDRYEVGLAQIADGVWSVFFGPVHLGWLDEADFRIMDVIGTKRRKNRRL
jgi:transposase InsO family protein